MSVMVVIVDLNIFILETMSNDRNVFRVSVCGSGIQQKNVDIKFSAQNTFLEKPSSGTLNIEIMESQII